MTIQQCHFFLNLGLSRDCKEVLVRYRTVYEVLSVIELKHSKNQFLNDSTQLEALVDILLIDWNMTAMNNFVSQSI